MNASERTYFDDSMCALTDVTDFEKPCMIVSAGKSQLAFDTVCMMGERANLHTVITSLICEDGEEHDHAFVSVRNHPGHSPASWGNRALSTLRIVERMREGEFSRANGQYLLGLALGYPIDETLDFIASDVARDCVCDCCGGPREA